MFASAEDFKALTPAFEDVLVPELGEGKTVRVRVMSALAKDRWEIAHFTTGSDGLIVPTFEGARSKLLIATCCHEDFTPLFTEADVAWLNEKRSDVVDRLYDAADRLNGANQGIEYAKKVFAAVRSGGATTKSQSGSATPQ